MTNWYETGHFSEGQFQVGFDETVLNNKFGLIDSNEMDEVELDILIQLTDVVLDDVTNIVKVISFMSIF